MQSVVKKKSVKENKGLIEPLSNIGRKLRIKKNKVWEREKTQVI